MSLKNLISRSTGQARGDQPTLAPPAASRRTGLELHNADPALDLWIVAAPAGAAAPTISAQDKDYAIPPGSTLVLEYAETLAVWVQNSSGAATTSPFVVKELAE